MIVWFPEDYRWKNLWHEKSSFSTWFQLVHKNTIHHYWGNNHICHMCWRILYTIFQNHCRHSVYNGLITRDEWNTYFIANLRAIKKVHESVYKRIFIFVRIEYRILFASAKLSESNSEYYLCCKIYSNNIRIVQNIRIFEYFRIICNAKMKNFPK